jgi:hypothetical protein
MAKATLKTLKMRFRKLHLFSPWDREVAAASDSEHVLHNLHAIVHVGMRRCVMVEKKRLQRFSGFVVPLGKVSQSCPFLNVVKQHTVQCYFRRCPTPISYRGAARCYLQELSVNANAIVRAALSGTRPHV